MAKRLLIVETVVFGLAMLLAMPMWAMVPMLLGVTKHTPAGEAWRVYALLLAFPVVATTALIYAWRPKTSRGWRGLSMALPLLHLAALFAVRIPH